MAHAASRFTLWKRPQHARLESIGAEGLTTLLAGGIVNPFGPTLNVLAADGIEGPDLPVVFLMLNAFSQQCQVVGRATIGDGWIPPQFAVRYFAERCGGRPTLLLPSLRVAHAEAVSLYSRFLQLLPDGGDVLTEVKRFPGDPWNRIQKAVDGIAARLEAPKAGRDEPHEPKPLTPSEAEELAETLLEPANLRAEMRAFLYAWNGSIAFQGDGGLADAALSVESFFEILAVVAGSCRIPGVEDETRPLPDGSGIHAG